MPNENTVFTPSSILFRPHQKPSLQSSRWFLVEAPGTAPGSDRFITQVIYRHSRRTGTLNIVWRVTMLKGEFTAGEDRLQYFWIASSIGGGIAFGQQLHSFMHFDFADSLQIAIAPDLTPRMQKAG